VIDFGIAKALTDEEGNDQRLAITQQPLFLGTPQYSSPEQAAARPGTVDHRSDVYSLGAMLYELLTDTPPFEASQLRAMSFAEILALLRDADPPPPSVRLAARQMRKRGEQVRGDLDWIVMKAMDKNPSQRYDSAEALADDVRRFLAKEPVSAAPPGRIYRIRKLIQRRRMAVGISIAAAMVSFSLLGGIVVVILARPYGSRTAASPATQSTLTLSPPTAPSLPPAVVSTQPAPLGMDVLQPGLMTELFASAEFKNPMGSRVDRQIDFDWPPGIPPDKGMPAPRYSVRWMGVLLVPPEGIEGIGYWVNGTGQVELDGLLVMRLDESSRKFVTLKIAGGRHGIVIEYRNRKGAGHATLYWRTKDGVEEKVPAEALFHVAAAP
jgi:serine/threonine protein kinase